MDCFIVALAEKENAVVYTTDSGIERVYKNTKVILHS
ncbi:putative nucleic acid-binding protein [Sulfurisphaera ohwakuensis]|uniref:Putative nucleic acid-binding protein n=1 Tax=Sulfurisphaera ohwakuensis TaxID=69656 RepID=A0A7J9RXV7_SULOH|nr:putative nucleic acid-binding protein [Sulfurisphaera ohwakuensis]